MVASILYLQRRDIKTMEKVPDAYGIHKLVYSLFPGDKRNFLFLDKGGRYGERQILIISKDQPVPNTIGEIQSKIIPESFLSYAVYAFEVKLNPIKRLNSTGKAVPILGEENLKAWFLSRQASWGFSVELDRLEVYDTGIQKFQRGGTDILHNTATFKGILKVEDKGLFQKSFNKGMGRGKAFGFGLLQLYPIKMEKE